MDKPTFKTIVEASEARRRDLREKKGKEYTRGEADVLSNFKRVGLALEGVHITKDNAALISWWIYANKHWDAVVSYIKQGKEVSNETIEGRIDDLHVYLDLLLGIVEERRQMGEPAHGEEWGDLTKGASHSFGKCNTKGCAFCCKCDSCRAGFRNTRLKTPPPASVAEKTREIQHREGQTCAVYPNCQVCLDRAESLRQAAEAAFYCKHMVDKRRGVACAECRNEA